MLMLSKAEVLCMYVCMSRLHVKESQNTDPELAFTCECTKCRPGLAWMCPRAQCTDPSWPPRVVVHKMQTRAGLDVTDSAQNADPSWPRRDRVHRIAGLDVTECTECRPELAST